MKKNPNSAFIDQGMFYPVLYSDNYSLDVKTAVKTYGIYGIRLLREKRLKLLVDLQDWADYLLSEKFSFSCGSRIHGNILPILCGIPAAICPPDARVREMAEFYEIPMITEADMKKRSLYEIYSETSYHTFNKNFAAKFDAYEAFLRERGIVNAVNEVPMLRTSKNGADNARLVEIESLIHRERINALYDHACRNPAWRMYGAARNSAVRVIDLLNRRK